MVVEQPVMKEMRVPEIKQHQIQQHQPQIQEIQIQRPEAHPLIIANVLNNHAAMLNGGQQQLIQTANGQIIQAQIGQFIQGPNNTIQMITTNAQNVCNQQPQLLQLRTEPENRCELIVQPSDMNEQHYFDEIPVVVQSANGQQTILNLPHHQVQALQQQIAQSQSVNNNQQQQQQQQVQIQQLTSVPSQATCQSETDEIEIHEVQDFEDFEVGCDDEVMEDINNEDDGETETYFTLEAVQEESSDNSDDDNKQLLAEFLAQQTHSEPGRHVCNLCNQEFKHMKWLHSHMKSIHINWIKANCKKQPQCSICHKSFRGPGMLKMHMKVSNKDVACQSFLISDNFVDAREGEQASNLQHLLEGVQIKVNSLPTSGDALLESKAASVHAMRQKLLVELPAQPAHAATQEEPAVHALREVVHECQRPQGL